MNEFLKIVLHELQEAIGQAIFVLLLAAGIVSYVYVKYKGEYTGKLPLSIKKFSGSVLAVI